MRQRLLSAAVLVPVVIGLFVLGGPWLWLAIAGLAGLAAFEAARLLRGAGMPAETWLAVALAAATVIALPSLVGPGGVEIGAELVAPAAALLLIVSALPALRHHDPATGIRSWMGTLIAAGWPGLLAFAAALLAFGRVALEQPLPFGVDAGRAWLLVLVLTVWALDSAAYVVGRALPRGRFFTTSRPTRRGAAPSAARSPARRRRPRSPACCLATRSWVRAWASSSAWPRRPAT